MLRFYDPSYNEGVYIDEEFDAFGVKFALGAITGSRENPNSKSNQVIECSVSIDGKTEPVSFSMGKSEYADHGLRVGDPITIFMYERFGEHPEPEIVKGIFEIPGKYRAKESVHKMTPEQMEELKPFLPGGKAAYFMAMKSMNENPEMNKLRAMAEKLKASAYGRNKSSPWTGDSAGLNDALSKAQTLMNTAERS